jgi:plasmanylethanolamine desaturase
MLHRLRHFDTQDNQFPNLLAEFQCSGVMHAYLIIALQVVGVLLAVDLLAGFIHWIEDAYIREHTLLLGRWIGRANTLHHHLPRQMTQNTWWQSNWDLLLVMSLVVLAAYWLDRLTWQVALFALCGANANEVHKWSHRTRRENGPIISFLQDIRLLQTPRQHAIHHTNPKQVCYCPVTNALNPVLDALRFWPALEWLLAKSIGLTRQPDTSVPGQGEAPEWVRALRARR